MSANEGMNRTGEQMTLFDQDSWFGKTSSVRYPQETPKERTSELSSKRSQESSTPTPLFLDLRTWNGLTWGAFWETDSLSLGEYTTRSFGESPNVAVESRLSQILEECPPPRYCLSEKACQGILARAKKRGKILPPLLEAALTAQSHFVNDLETNGGGGKGILIQNESVGTISTLSNLHKVAYNKDHIKNEDAPESYDARGKGNGKVTPTLTGDHQRRVSDYTALVCYQGSQITSPINKSDPQEGDPCHTLNQDSRNIVVYGIGSYESNGMKSDNPNAGIYEAETARTLDLNGGSPACNQGGTMIVESYRQDKYDKYEPTDTSSTIKSAGGTFGGGE